MLDFEGFLGVCDDGFVVGVGGGVYLCDCFVGGWVDWGDYVGVGGGGLFVVVEVGVSVGCVEVEGFEQVRGYVNFCCELKRVQLLVGWGVVCRIIILMQCCLLVGILVGVGRMGVQFVSFQEFE